MEIKASGDYIEVMSHYVAMNKLALNVHKLLILLFTPDNFSSLYSRWLNQRFARKNIFATVFARLLIKSTPKLKIEHINKVVTYITTFFIKRNLPSEKIINITIPTVPFLLANKNKRVYSILESWDHAGKSPMGFVSKKVFLWNESLREEWLKHQNDNDISFAYPIKLAYAVQSVKKNKKEKRVVLYPFSTSADSPQISLYNEEVKFVNHLCNVLNVLGYKILLKPKPNTKIGELDFLNSHENVEICSYQKNDGGSSYQLSEDYNKTRLQELALCDYVITIGTTFAFDAASFGVPVLQFIFLSKQNFPNLSKVANYPHISKLIFPKKQLLAQITDNDSVETQLANILSDPDYMHKATQFRNYLRDWLIPQENMQVSVARVIDEIIEDR